jgi:peptide/nickel transport system substrate-binding protein
VSPRLEALRDAWFAAPDQASQQRICREMQAQCMVDVPSIPLGQYVQPMAYRSNITGVKAGFPTFWGVQKS